MAAKIRQVSNLFEPSSKSGTKQKRSIFMLDASLVAAILPALKSESYSKSLVAILILSVSMFQQMEHIGFVAP